MSDSLDLLMKVLPLRVYWFLVVFCSIIQRSAIFVVGHKYTKTSMHRNKLPAKFFHLFGV